MRDRLLRRGLPIDRTFRPVELHELAVAPFGGLGGCEAEEVAGDIEMREAAAFLGQLFAIGLDEDLDRLFGGVDFDAQGRLAEIDFMASAGFAANDGVRHLRRGLSCGVDHERPTPKEHQIVSRSGLTGKELYPELGPLMNPFFASVSG